MHSRRWRTERGDIRTQRLAFTSLAPWLEAMETGVSIFLILTGAILAFAVELSPPGIDLRIVGVILLVVGAMGLIIAILDR
jgi:hypothetical protein